MIGEEALQERKAFAALDGAQEVVPPRIGPAGDRIGIARKGREHGAQGVAKGFAMGGVFEAGPLRAETEERDDARRDALAGLGREPHFALAEAGEDPLTFCAVERGIFRKSPRPRRAGWLARGQRAEIVDEEGILIFKPISQAGLDDACRNRDPSRASIAVMSHAPERAISELLSTRDSTLLSLHWEPARSET